MNKKRRAIYEKSNGHCWYCGCKLGDKGWHADHFEPIRRNRDGTCCFPERDTEENKVPACASCNNMKGSYDLEVFRNIVKEFITTLNKYSTQYKIAKRYGLIEEKPREVVFWFESNTLGGDGE
ncbi:HNH endonuclease signature motif containing protein [Exiguobacterium sp. s5]|uniref:HNH endonuclease n=1 Tax=Exiguobacterium sp. s5 TaxID=2751239 RepID=UPI001BE55249